MYYNKCEVSRLESRNCPVDVICVCSADGQIQPLRLRLEDEEQQTLQISIDRVLSREVTYYAGIETHVFFCRAMVYNRQWQFELRYAVNKHKWSLRRV